MEHKGAVPTAATVREDRKTVNIPYGQTVPPTPCEKYHYFSIGQKGCFRGVQKAAQHQGTDGKQGAAEQDPRNTDQKTSREIAAKKLTRPRTPTFDQCTDNTKNTE
jgi:hypothetical protein